MCRGFLLQPITAALINSSDQLIKVHWTKNQQCYCIFCILIFLCILLPFLSDCFCITLCHFTCENKNNKQSIKRKKKTACTRSFMALCVRENAALAQRVSGTLPLMFGGGKRCLTARIRGATVTMFWTARC